MKTKMFVAFFAVTLLAGCGQKEIVREVLVTTPPTVAETTPAPNKFDQYLEALYSESAQARTWPEADLLELGTIVCEVFDNGGTIQEVIEIFADNSNGAYDDELYSAIIAGSVIFLCPEWAEYVQSQLN